MRDPNKDALCRSVREVAKAARFNGVKPDVVLFEAAIGAYDDLKRANDIYSSLQPPDVRAAVDAKKATLSVGDTSTRDLLEELRMRGDLAMTIFPGSETGADGAVLSAIATAALKSSSPTTLAATRGKFGEGQIG